MITPRYQNISDSEIPKIEPQNKRIMIVDDNSDVVFTLRTGLQNSGETIKVDGFDNPVNALSAFEPDFYDLLLTDVNMPLMNGFELCQEMFKRDNKIKVYFMTSGEINMDLVRETHSLRNIGCFIKKPTTMDEILRRIKSELD
jgi:DNA-binding response OmpR family regulator